MAVHHTVGISRQRNSGYRLSMVNIMAQGLSTPDPSLSPTHLSIRRVPATTTHYTHHQVSLMVSRNTTLVPSLGWSIGPTCEAGLIAGMQRERMRMPPQKRKKERRRYFVLSARYSDLLVENREIVIPYLYVSPPQGVIPSEFRADVRCW